MEECSIGRMAELNGISERALRIYHEKGILKPARIDQETGYRYYSCEQSATIDMIHHLRSLGFSLDDIDDVQEEIDRLTLAQKSAEMMLKNYSILADHPICDHVILEHIEERTALFFEVLHPGAGILDGDADRVIQDWEINLRLTKRHLKENGFPVWLFALVGGHIKKESLLDGSFSVDKSFILIPSAGLPGSCREKLETIPENTYMTMYRNSYKTPEGENSEYQGIIEMLDFAEKNDLEIVGDYFGEIIADTPAFLYEGREMFYKLQIPVRSRTA
ncbi:MerR family transcriptional regulator [Slackia exigua]|nr:MerR family transcriptional regulator [Slackia exigua]MDK7724544.1 MerR family transcriptional regulator [Slackia exigua]MDK7724979.1 MerR family transcriptional regulator [Slackia exigua]